MTSKIKVDNINKVSDDSNIINKCGTNITMGQNGDTVIIPNGVTEQVQAGGNSSSIRWISYNCIRSIYY